MQDFERHQVAFRRWYARNADQIGSLLAPPTLQGGQMKSRVLRFASHLVVDVERHGMRVRARWDRSTWDIVWATDVSAARCESGFYDADTIADPTFCVFATLEALWEATLYEPLLCWLVERIADAAALYLHDAGKGRGRWALTLPYLETHAAASLRYVVLATPDPGG